jgi:hypothetical protein
MLSGQFDFLKILYIQCVMFVFIVALFKQHLMHCLSYTKSRCLTSMVGQLFETI